MWSLENPASSRLWQLPPIAELKGSPGFCEVSFHMCHHNEPWRKPTTIWPNMPELYALGGFCNQQHSHVVLQGSCRVRVDGAWQWVRRTSLAGAYGPVLCRRWARALLRAAPAEARGASSPLGCRMDDGLASALSSRRALSTADARAGECHAAAEGERYLSREPFRLVGRYLGGLQPR